MSAYGGPMDADERKAILIEARDALRGQVCAKYGIPMGELLDGPRTPRLSAARRLVSWSLFSAGFRVYEVASVLTITHSTVSRDIKWSKRTLIAPLRCKSVPMLVEEEPEPGTRRTIKAALAALSAAIGQDAEDPDSEAARRRYDVAVERVLVEPDEIAARVWREFCRVEFPHSWRAQAEAMPGPYERWKRWVEASTPTAGDAAVVG